MRTVVIGIDGLDLRYLDRYASSLPAISGLRDRGVETPLESTHPPALGCAWPSLYTGTEPSYHGVYGSVAYETYPDEPRPVSRIDVRRPALWDYLSSEGAHSVVVDVPVTHPADPIHGVLVPGESPAGTDPAHPPGIRDDLGEPFTRRSSGGSPTVGELCTSIDRRRRVTLELLERSEWELATVRVGELEEARTVVGDDADLEALYERVDLLVGDVVEAVGEETNVVCCSVRGSGPLTGYRIHVNEVLREIGFLEASAAGEPSPPSFEVDERATTAGRPDVFERLVRAGTRVVEKSGLGFALDRLESLSSESRSERVDWYTSLAYCPDEASYGVRINLAGREPYGTVPPSRYESVCDELVSHLSALETPDGEPAFDFVCRRDHLHGGTFLEGAPDVCFVPAEPGHDVSAALTGRRFESVDAIGPALEGVFVGAGPGFTGAFDPYRLRVVDVAPITMALLGRPIPSLMTGSVPEGLLVDPARRARYDDLVYGAAATDPYFDDGDVCSRLEDVDYR